jgi:hypothetical protein
MIEKKVSLDQKTVKDVEKIAKKSGLSFSSALRSLILAGLSK